MRGVGQAVNEEAVGELEFCIGIDTPGVLVFASFICANCTLSGRGAERTLPAKTDAIAVKEMAERIIVLLKGIDVKKSANEGNTKS